MFYETIQYYNTFLNLSWHQKRMNNTFLNYYGIRCRYDLEELLQVNIPIEQNTKYRCRFSYSDIFFELNMSKYCSPIIEKIILMNDDEIQYSSKFLHRICLNKYNNILNAHEEIIFIKNGFVTDSRFSNCCFWDGNKWVTPTTYLLNGTKRQQLLADGKIVEQEIKLNDLELFSKVSFINAMNDLGELELNI